jgi:hypothetical protein
MIGLKFRGRPAIKIAKTVRDIAHFNNEYANTIMDRSQVIDEEFIGAIIAQGIMSYAGREPQPALDEDGNFQCTDLDLLSFLSPIAARGAVIEIPRYRNRRQIVKREGERKIGTNQFGPITSLVSNKEVFSFSVKIHDKTIVVKDSETGREEIGAFRNYMLVDCDGHWYDGWNKIVWDPSAEENAFLNDHRLWTGNTVYFQYYVHPNRWQSVFGAPHLLKKMLITRLEDEASYYRKEIDRLLEAGIHFPGTGNGPKASHPVIETGETMPIKVQTMDMILSVPEFTGSYPAVPNTPEGLAMAYRRQKLLTYTLKPAVQFVVRANEAAYLRYGFESDGKGRIAHWLSNREWKPFKKTPRSSEYQSLVLSNDMALMYRVKMKTEQVSAE